MDRRDFLKTGSAVAASVAAGGAAAQPQLQAPAVQSGAIRLLLATRRGLEAPRFSARRLARRIETVSGGRIRIELVRMLHSDPVDLAETQLILGSAHEHARYYPAFTFFAGLPRAEGFDASTQAAWLAVGGGQMLWDELGAQFGFKPLLAGHTGPSGGLWSSRRLETVADFAGARLFATGLAADVAGVLGAHPVAMAPEDLAAALGDGRLEAAEWLGPLAALTLQPPAERLYTPGLTPGGMALSLTVRRGLWERMDAAEQAILQTCATAECHASLVEAHAHAVVEAQATASVQRFALGSDVVAALDRAAADAVDHLASLDPHARRIADSHGAFRALTGAVPTLTS